MTNRDAMIAAICAQDTPHWGGGDSTPSLAFADSLQESGEPGEHIVRAAGTANDRKGLAEEHRIQNRSSATSGPVEERTQGPMHWMVRGPAYHSHQNGWSQIPGTAPLMVGVLHGSNEPRSFHVAAHVAPVHSWKHLADLTRDFAPKDRVAIFRAAKRYFERDVLAPDVQPPVMPKTHEEPQKLARDSNRDPLIRMVGEQVPPHADHTPSLVLADHLEETSTPGAHIVRAAAPDRHALSAPGRDWRTVADAKSDEEWENQHYPEWHVRGHAPQTKGGSYAISVQHNVSDPLGSFPRAVSHIVPVYSLRHVAHMMRDFPKQAQKEIITMLRGHQLPKTDPRDEEPRKLARIKLPGVKTHGTNDRALEDARTYHEKYGAELGLAPHTADPSQLSLTPEQTAKIVYAYETRKHDPNDPETKAAYDAYKRETLQQYNHAVSRGLKVQRWEQEGQPYANSQAMRDHLDRDHSLFYFPTAHGYDSADASTNPLLEQAPGHPPGVVYNDLFRAVHEYFGHGMHGHEFGPKGEVRAWHEHAKLYSPLARKALTNETLGQTQWFFHGPHAEKPVSERPFPEQRTALLPQHVEPDLGAQKLARQKAPAGGAIVNNQFGKGGQFLPRAFARIRDVAKRAFKLARPGEGAITVRPHEGPPILGTDYMHPIHDETGNKIGHLWVTPKDNGETLHINHVGAAGHAPNAIGPAHIRTALRQLKTLYPSMKRVTGTRISGANPDRPVSRTVEPEAEKQAGGRFGVSALGQPIGRFKTPFEAAGRPRLGGTLVGRAITAAPLAIGDARRSVVSALTPTQQVTESSTANATWRAEFDKRAAARQAGDAAAMADRMRSAGPAQNKPAPIVLPDPKPNLNKSPTADVPVPGFPRLAPTGAPVVREPSAAERRSSTPIVETAPKTPKTGLQHPGRVEGLHEALMANKTKLARSLKLNVSDPKVRAAVKQRWQSMTREERQDHLTLRPGEAREDRLRRIRASLFPTYGFEDQRAKFEPGAETKQMQFEHGMVPPDQAALSGARTERYAPGMTPPSSRNAPAIDAPIPLVQAWGEPAWRERVKLARPMERGPARGPEDNPYQPTMSAPAILAGHDTGTPRLTLGQLKSIEDTHQLPPNKRLSPNVSQSVMGDEHPFTAKVERIAQFFDDLAAHKLGRTPLRKILADPKREDNEKLVHMVNHLGHELRDLKGQTKSGGNEWYGEKINQLDAALHRVMTGGQPSPHWGTLDEKGELVGKHDPAAHHPFMAMFKALIAATSAAQNPKDNLATAFKIWRTGHRANPQDPIGGAQLYNHDAKKQWFDSLNQLNNQIVPPPPDDVRGKAKWFAKWVYPHRKQLSAREGAIGYSTLPSQIIVHDDPTHPHHGTLVNTIANGRTVNDPVGTRIARYTNGKVVNADLPMTDKAGGVKSKGWTVRGKGVANQIEKLQRLVKHFSSPEKTPLQSYRDAADWLFKMHTLEEMAPVLRSMGIKNLNTGFVNPKTELIPGAFVLGPKFGPFFLNLHMNDPVTREARGGYLTADKWWTRLWNRYAGRLMGKSGKINESPAGQKERRLMLAAARRAAKKIGQPVANLQADLWYYEQQLWRMFGGEGMESYDFADAAKHLPEKLKRRKV